MYDKLICGGCPAENEGCRIKFIEVLRHFCVCRSCLIKMMCKTMCEERENMFVDLPDYIKNYLDEITHYYNYNGEREYNQLMNDLERLVKEADIGAEYE